MGKQDDTPDVTNDHRRSRAKLRTKTLEKDIRAAAVDGVIVIPQGAVNPAATVTTDTL